TAQAPVAPAGARRFRVQGCTPSVPGAAGVHAASDTREVIVALASKRAERARLLGSDHHAAYVAGGGTARTTEAINTMLGRLAAPAVRNARAEGAELGDTLADDQPEAEPADRDLAV